jgi:antitoxin CptB
MADRNRIYWQCRRGMLELDTLLQGFFLAQYDSLKEDERAAFKTLLTCSDEILLEYLMGRMRPIDPTIAYVVDKIRYSA